MVPRAAHPRGSPLQPTVRLLEKGSCCARFCCEDAPKRAWRRISCSTSAACRSLHPA